MKKKQSLSAKNRQIKKSAALSIAILLLLFLAGCGKGGKGETSSSAKHNKQNVSSKAVSDVSSEVQSEPDAAEIAETAESKEFTFEDVILTLLGHFDVTVEPDNEFAQYTDPYFGFLNVTLKKNSQIGQNTPDGEFVTEVTNDDIGTISVYKFSEGYAAEFAVGTDVYHLEFRVNSDRGIKVEDAEFWFFNTATQLKLTQNGKDSALTDGDSKALQAFYMPTFESMTGTTPYKFTASNPQPNTVYLIISGDGFTENHRLVKFDERTEAEYSERFSDSMNTLKQMLANDDRTLIYTNDPNRASMIIIKEYKYKKSSREYTALTAYNCEYTETAIDTATHESKSFSAVTYPDYVLRDIPMGMRNYYCSTTYDLYDYKDFLRSVVSWLE